MQLILASASQGRKKLLKLLKIPFEIIPSTLDEEKIIGKTPLETIQLRARLKSEDVASKLSSPKSSKEHTVLQENESILILSADSGAIIDNQLIGKPKDRGDAERILRLLSGTTHEFVTAIYIIRIRLQGEINSWRNQKIWQTFDRSFVTLRKLSKEDIKRYLSMNDYSKFAGGYAFSACPQCLSPIRIKVLSKKPYYELSKELSTDNCMHGRRASPQDFIIKVEGSLSNVIGLPIEKVLPILKENYRL